MNTNEIVGVWDKLPVNEKESVKYMLLLFPCYFSVQYLFNPDFGTLSVFLQCVFAAATTIIMYAVFSFGTLGVSIISNIYRQMEFRAFRGSIISIILLVVIGHFFGYSICLLRWFYGILIVVYFIRIPIEVFQRKPTAGK